MFRFAELFGRKLVSYPPVFFDAICKEGALLRNIAGELSVAVNEQGALLLGGSITAQLRRKGRFGFVLASGDKKGKE